MSKIKFALKPSTDEVTYLDHKGILHAGKNRVPYELDKFDESFKIVTDDWYYTDDLDALIRLLHAARKALRKLKVEA